MGKRLRLVLKFITLCCRYSANKNKHALGITRKNISLFFLIVVFQTALSGQENYSLSGALEALDKPREAALASQWLYHYYKNRNQPDSALIYLQLFQKNFRKAPASIRRKLEKSGINNSHLRSLKTTLEVSLARMALESEDISTVNQILTGTFSLPSELADSLLHKKFWIEAQKLLARNDFKTFYPDFLATAGDIIKHAAEAYPEILRHAQLLFFAHYDAGEILNLIHFAELFPELSDQADSLLSGATRKWQYLDLLEVYLQQWETANYPLTLEALLDAYLSYGQAEDLKYFYATYPYCTSGDSIPEYINLINKLRSDPDNYLNWKGRLASQYFVYQIFAKKFSGDYFSGREIPTLPAFDSISFTRLPREKPEIPIPFSQGINTEAREYAPLRSADGKLLYFCRRINGQEDIYVSRYENGQWVEAMPLDMLNHPRKNDAPLSISADGTYMLLFRDGMVMWTERKKTGWQDPKPLFDESYQSSWQGITTISADKRVLIFAARRRDALGFAAKAHSDIYLSHKQADGSWSEPQNLGPVINTPFTDRSPFLHPDMRTLYFSSEGHGGLGGLDVFKSTRIGEGWDQWSEPINLGAAINTAADDWGYKVTTDGQKAYFASGSATSNEDIFEIPLPRDFRPLEVSLFSGQLTDTKGRTLSGKLLIRDSSDSGEVDIVQTDEEGNFVSPLLREKQYRILFLTGEALPMELAIDGSVTPDGKTIELEGLEEIGKTPYTFVLPDLQFDTDSKTIRPESYAWLDVFAEWVKENHLILEIRGHTDDVGDEAYNQQLSEQRAQAVKDYLSSAGCPTSTLFTKGFGMSSPLQSGTSAEIRAKNRRVEVVILGRSKPD